MVLSGGINQKIIQKLCEQSVLSGNCQDIFRDTLTGVAGAGVIFLHCSDSLNAATRLIYFGISAASIQAQIIQQKGAYLALNQFSVQAGNFTEESLTFLMDAFKGRVSAIERDSKITASLSTDMSLHISLSHSIHFSQHLTFSVCCND